MSAQPLLASGRERRTLSGVPGLLLSLAAGGLAGLSHPPFGILPGLLGFALLLHLIDAASERRPLRSAFARGWAAGFGYFLVGTWWIVEAFMVDKEAHAWQAPFAVVLLPAGLGLFWGAAGLAYRAIAPARAGRVAVFAAVFGLAEWLMGHVLTGFPWDLPGEAWQAGSPPSQAAALFGAYALTTLTLAIAASPAALAGPGSRKSRIAVLGLAGAALAALWLGGTARLSGAVAGPEGPLVRIVQPDIPQAAKWSPEAFRTIVDRYVSLTATPAPQTPAAVIWPESAIPADAGALFAPDAWTNAAIARAMQPGQVLLAGAVRSEGERYFNSFLALRRTDAGFALEASYDKHRLVPFGEYLPMEGLVARLGLKKLVAVEGGFETGPRPAPISVAGLPRMQPLICYEGLFPGLADPKAPRPAWIVNVSNDAWFGATSGPLQHLNLASYRAIEAGAPLLRATPTGVSAVIDAYGRTLTSLPHGRRGVIDARLPPALAQTPYQRFGDLVFWLMTLAGLGFAAIRGQGSRP